MTARPEGQRDVLAVPISVGRQEREPTDPRLTFYRTRLNFGDATNPGNTMAFVFGNNGSNAAEQMAFAEALAQAYNSRAAVAELIAADREYDEAKEAFVASIPAGSETGTNVDERRRYAAAADRRRAALAACGATP